MEGCVNKIGISNISVYIPKRAIKIDEIVKNRLKEKPENEKRLKSAVAITGQKIMRFPYIWEDSATMAGQATYELLKNLTSSELSSIRYMSAGTETTVDYSKPIAAYVEGMLQKAGLSIPSNLSTFQVQHACAGGTISMISINALLQTSPHENERGVVMCSDISRYKTETTAEITQGAGAVALLLEKNPKLIQLETGVHGFASKDVDDFFRPLGSITAKVKGRYSMSCFQNSLLEAFEDFCKHKNAAPGDILDSTDFFVFHTPFSMMPVLAMKTLLSKYYEFSEDEAEKYMKQKGLYAAINAIAAVGNIYSGALYLNLFFLLLNKYKEFGRDIIGKKILLASYGSGNTMIVLNGTIADGAPDIIKNWDGEKLMEDKRFADFNEYSKWVNEYYHKECTLEDPDCSAASPGSFHIISVREDGYREYGIK